MLLLLLHLWVPCPAGPSLGPAPGLELTRAASVMQRTHKIDRFIPRVASLPILYIVI